MANDTFYIPYCGTPPGPEVLWSRWNLDPMLLVALLVLAIGFGWHLYSHVDAGTVRRERASFAAGWTVLALALVSPLCNLSVALFSARAGQHMLLILVAAPLLALSRPSLALGPAFRMLASPVVSAAMFGVFLWFWHLPTPYQWTFESHVAYWSMHVTLTGSAIWLWKSFFTGARDRLTAGLLAGFATLVHMGLLGAIITLAPRVLYPVHMLTTEAWGLQPIEDQQLGGLIMWVPGGALLALILLVKFSELLREPARQAL